MSRTGTTTRDRTRGSQQPAARRGGTSVAALPSRRRERTVRPLRRLLRAGVAVVLVVGAAWALLASPLLAVRQVQVDGTATLQPGLVREAAGIAEGTPLLRVDVAAAQARVARLPQVASAEVNRGWPDRVVITVVERVALAVVGTPGRRALVDADGVLFDTITGSAPRGVVPIEVASPGPGDPATMAALSAVAALPPAVRTQVTVVAATGAGEIAVSLKDGTEVRWGSAERAQAKASALAGLLQQIAAGRLDPAATIDVSTPDDVVLR
jgi:cell division protein FtsQ